MRPRPLPYADNALEPVIGARALRVHYDEHYLRYVARARAGDELAAIQAKLHELFFDSMVPRHEPRESLESLVEPWVEASKAVVGSGWVWLLGSEGKVRIAVTGPASFPELRPGEHIRLVMDVWEHSYYLDYLNDRPTYARRWLLELARWP